MSDADTEPAGLLVCPHCEAGRSFDLRVVGVQDNAALERGPDGDVRVRQAGAITVKSYDDTRLRCRECGATVAEENLLDVQA